MISVRRWPDFSNSNFRVTRSLWSYAKVQRLVAALLRNRRIQLRKSDIEAQYVNAGCGTKIADGLCNIDYLWAPGVVCWDLTKGMPFAEGSLRGIYAEHCLEHLPYDQALSVLRIFRRTLRPGGVARVVVPDGELYCRLYVKAIQGEAVCWPYPQAEWTSMAHVNRVMRDHGHQFIYDYETLESTMLRAGFRQVHRTNYRQGREPALLIDQDWREVESLYVEGVA